jgi:23S rRNA pseudouridine2605 synthase
MEGIEVDGIHCGCIDANMERRTGRNQWIELTLSEETAKCAPRAGSAGLQVSRLMCLKYGPFERRPARGQAIQIPQVQVERFRKAESTARLPTDPDYRYEWRRAWPRQGGDTRPPLTARAKRCSRC